MSNINLKHSSININHREEKLLSNITDFKLSDSDISDDETTKNDLKINSDLLDKLELKYYPEPYNTIGQFMISAISGTAISYILSIRAKKIHPYIKHLNTYFDYCKNTETDDYIDSLLIVLKLDKSNNEDKKRFIDVFNRINILCCEIMEELIKSTKESYQKYILISDKEFSMAWVPEIEEFEDEIED